MTSLREEHFVKNYRAATATFPPEVRRAIDTSNATESLNYQLRKIPKNCGHVPADDASQSSCSGSPIRNIEDERSRRREKEHERPTRRRKANSRLIEAHREHELQTP